MPTKKKTLKARDCFTELVRLCEIIAYYKHDEVDLISCRKLINPVLENLCDIRKKMREEREAKAAEKRAEKNRGFVR